MGALEVKSLPLLRSNGTSRASQVVVVSCQCPHCGGDAVKIRYGRTNCVDDTIAGDVLRVYQCLGHECGKDFAIRVTALRVVGKQATVAMLKLDADSTAKRRNRKAREA